MMRLLADMSGQIANLAKVQAANGAAAAVQPPTDESLRAYFDTAKSLLELDTEEGEQWVLGC
jgi:hypothetical protein